ncbi:MAG TPA: enoyl-CoA hydratase/isomerase family protein, partial [Bauldia sp.]|nr:enoyl-CoA hydratase/isomerase family protein [Bauldia sp.]
MTEAPDRNRILVERARDHVAVVRIASEPLGVLRVAVKERLLAVLRDLDADPSVRAVVLTGQGRAFSVGSDVREFQPDPGWLLAAEYAENGVNDFIEASRLPVIAAVNGDALGGGVGVPLAPRIPIPPRRAPPGVPEGQGRALP